MTLLGKALSGGFCIQYQPCSTFMVFSNPATTVDVWRQPHGFCAIARASLRKYFRRRARRVQSFARRRVRARYLRRPLRSLSRSLIGEVRGRGLAS